MEIVDMDLKTVLVVVDPTSENDALLERAVMIGTCFNARLELFVAEHRGVLEPSYPLEAASLEAAMQGLVTSKQQWLDAYVERLTQAGVQVTTEVRWARHLYDAVLERADEIQADLILKETHQHSLLKRALFTNTDWHLMRETSRPIWFVKREHVWNARRRLLAAVDPVHAREKSPELDLRILEIAKLMATHLPAELHVVHAYEVAPTGLMAEFDTLIKDFPSYRREVMKRHRTALENLMATAAPEAISYLEDGVPERVLPQFVNRNAIDLTVMGAVSRSGVDRILIGSTAERVLDNLESDILVVR